MLYEQYFPQKIYLTNGKLDLLYEILHPVDIILKAICTDDTDLLKAEYSIEFLLDKLNIVGNPLALNLCERLMHQYNKRRNVKTLTLLSYLYNPRKFKNKSIFGPFLFLTKQLLRKYAEQAYRRLFPGHHEENTTELCKENEIEGNLKQVLLLSHLLPKLMMNSCVNILAQ